MDKKFGVQKPLTVKTKVKFIELLIKFNKIDEALWEAREHFQRMEKKVGFTDKETYLAY